VSKGYLNLLAPLSLVTGIKAARCVNTADWENLVSQPTTGRRHRVWLKLGPLEQIEIAADGAQFNCLIAVGAGGVRNPHKLPMRTPQS
jgi:hypothetical protein